VDCREDVFVDRPEQKDEQGLRAAGCYERGVHLHSYDPTDGKAVSPCPVVFGQFRKANSQKFALRVDLLLYHRLGWPSGGYGIRMSVYDLPGAIFGAKYAPDAQGNRGDVFPPANLCLVAL
jgi:hypothetical protein